MNYELNLKNIFSIVDNYDVFLFDVWGVIAEGGHQYPGVVNAINKLIESKRVSFISNAPRSARFSLERILSFGINANIEMITTSGEIARDVILTKTNSLIYHLGSDRNKDLLADINISLTEDIYEADILLLSLYRDDFENLNEFDNLLKIAASRNIISICANPDTLIVNDGSTRYCAGYFAGKIEQMGGKVIYTGKPAAEIFSKVLSQTSTPKNRILMIGDTFETDILGANRAGIDSALTLTGNAGKICSAGQLLDDKLKIVERKARELSIYPTFIIEVQEDEKTSDPR